ncbi:MAG TPA: YCF48-related protein [Candidatus Acidoferrales bacterium]|nr:YCF48-related protein [Candidatus Acidoferrales bacterium]
MRDVPKIVLKRLQETEAAGAHPDADLLTAFAEQSLIQSERARVMEHLAHCSDCREVVAFALPATETVAVAASDNLARARWLSWPVLRWSVAIAGMIVITSIGIVQYRQRQKSDALVASLNQRNETAATEEQALPPSPPASEPQGNLLQTEKEMQEQLKRKALSSQADNLLLDRLVRPVNPTSPAASAMHRPPSRSATGGSVRVGVAGGAAPKAALSSPRDTFAVAGDSKNAMSAAAAKPAPSSSARQVVKVPPSSQTLEVAQSEAAPAAGTTPNQASDQLVEKEKDQALQYQYSIRSESNEAKNRATPQAGSGGASAPAPVPPKFAEAPALMQHTSPQWSISADGTLQRSLDAGKTWMDVNVNSEPVSGRSNAAITAESSYGHENRKKKVEAQPRPVFRAVSAQGAEVWAGGSSAMLYHSTDSGTHWTRVLPASAAATLTGDIVSIEFFDSQHGRIATSAGEVWITSDDGQTWRRQ